MDPFPFSLKRNAFLFSHILFDNAWNERGQNSKQLISLYKLIEIYIKFTLLLFARYKCTNAWQTIQNRVLWNEWQLLLHQ